MLGGHLAVGSSASSAVARMFAKHELDQRGDAFVSLDRVPKRKIASHLVAIPTTMASPLEVPSFLQLGDDPLNGALGDADEVSDVAHPRLRLPRNAQEDVRVVGEKRPGRLWFSGGPSRRRPPCCRFLAPDARCSQWVTFQGERRQKASHGAPCDSSRHRGFPWRGFLLRLVHHMRYVIRETEVVSHSSHF